MYGFMLTMAQIEMHSKIFIQICQLYSASDICAARLNEYSTFMRVLRVILRLLLKMSRKLSTLCSVGA